MSQYLAAILNKACTDKFPHVLPDSRTLIRQLDGVRVARDSILVTYDVVDMYPSIDKAAAVRAAAASVPARQRGMVEEMASFVLDNTYCTRDGIVYQQTAGVAMGTACAPPLANIYMAVEFEQCARQLASSWPQYYFRLIDDGAFIWEGDKDSLQQFIQLLNTLLPNIKLKFATSDTCLQYLDVWIRKDMSGAASTVPIVFSTYQKPHNKYLYIPYQSHHRLHVFKAFIHGELVRYVVTNTYAADFDKMSAVFWQRLRARGYPPAFLQPLFAAVAHSNRQQYLQQAVRQNAARTATRAAPVLVMTNGRVERQCMNLGQVVNNVLQQYSHVPELQALFGDRVVVAYRNPPSLRKLLVKAKH
jgi:hypothetical protein